MEWQGEEYVFTPSNKLLLRIENKGVNIATFISGLTVGPVSVPSLALVAAEFLKAGGAKVTEDDVYGFIMTAETSEIEQFAMWVAQAITPEERDGKKQRGQDKKPDGRKPKKKRG